jgi:hypothetical protein
MADVKTFGAVGDGATDDTLAFQTCIDAGACDVPAGTYNVGALSVPEGRTITTQAGAAIVGYANPHDVRNYGAKCDGVTDDRAAIVAALAVGDAYIPAGTTRTSPFAVPAHRRLYGAGSTLSALRAVDGLEEWDRLITIANAGLATVHGLEVIGSGDTNADGGEQAHSIWVSGAIDTRIADCLFRKPCGDSVTVNGSERTLIERCVFTDQGRGHVVINGVGTKNTSVLDSIFTVGSPSSNVSSQVGAIQVEPAGVGTVEGIVVGRCTIGGAPLVLGAQPAGASGLESVLRNVSVFSTSVDLSNATDGQPYGLFLGRPDGVSIQGLSLHSPIVNGDSVGGAALRVWGNVIKHLLLSNVEVTGSWYGCLLSMSPGSSSSPEPIDHKSISVGNVDGSAAAFGTSGDQYNGNGIYIDRVSGARIEDIVVGEADQRGALFRSCEIDVQRLKTFNVGTKHFVFNGATGRALDCEADSSGTGAMLETNGADGDWNVTQNA